MSRIFNWLLVSHGNHHHSSKNVGENLVAIALGIMEVKEINKLIFFYEQEHFQTFRLGKMGRRRPKNINKRNYYTELV